MCNVIGRGLKQVEKEAVQLTERKELNTQLPFYRNVKFLLYWFATMFSGMTLSMYMIGESWYVVNALNKKEALGLVMMCTTIPRLVLMLLGGVVADRFRRSFIILISNISRTVLLLGMIVLLFFDSLDLWILILLALCFGLLDAFYWPASQSILPSLVRKDELTRANSVMQTTQQLSLIAGPVLAGWMLTYTSYEGLFATCASLLLVGGLILFFIREPYIYPEKIRQSPIMELKEGFRYIRSSTFLLTAMITSAIINFFYTGMLSMGIPIIVKELLNGDAVDLSLLESAFSGGMVLGWSYGS